MISIIISAYNAESTIERAIISCLNQTYKDIEVIIINDCSTDNTENVIFNIKDKRIKYYKNKINRGAGYTRWRGTHHIKGEYSIFLDSDDYLKEDLVETMYNAAIKYDADLVCSGYQAIYKDKLLNKVCSPKELVLKGIDKYINLSNKAHLFIHGSIIKSTLWKQVEYNKRRYIEDSPTLIQLIWVANKRVFIPYTGYYYTQNEGSLIHTATKYKNILYRCLCAISSIEFFKGKYEKFTDIKYLKNIISELNNIKITKKEYYKYKKELNYIMKYYNTHK